MISFTDFITKYNGKGIDFDGYYGDQCVDLMNQYIVECLGLTLQGLGGDTAYNIYLNANNPNFQKIPNTPTGVPQNGDIVFWNTTVGSAGHVAIFISGDVNQFTSFDQNWPVNSVCHKQTHDYKGVAGWLHRTSTDTLESLRKQRDDNWNLYQTALSNNTTLQSKIDSLTKKLSDIKTIIG